MATVNKNFRIKNGLVVEGSTATVNGQNILTETGGDAYILNLVGGATLVKSVSSDFTVTGGGELQVNNSSDLARTGDISTHAGLTSTHGVNGDIVGTSDSQTLTNKTINDATFNVTVGLLPVSIDIGVLSGASSNIQNQLNDKLESADLSGYATESYVDTAIGNIDLTYTTDDVTEGSNLYFTNQRALDATASAYDASGAASSAEAAANTYTDNAINALDTMDIPENIGATNLYFTDARARGAVSAGSGLSYNSGTGEFSVDTTTIATQTYVDNAIDNLVDGAPGLLDTLNEIAAAINDDANYFTTVANSIAAKQDALTAGSNIDISLNAGALTISVTGLDTDDVAEGSNLYFTDTRARDAVDGTDRSFTSLEINEVSKEVAATTGNIATAAATTAYSWLKADYRSAKFLVKIKNGSHTEVSEVLVTLDTSDNVYLTEYGMSSTSGTSLGTISADVSGNDVRIRVTPANNNSEVMVAGSLLI